MTCWHSHAWVASHSPKNPSKWSTWWTRRVKSLQAEQQGRKLEIKIGQLPACKADPALLKQVWINLLANSLKFTRQRDVARIEVSSIRMAEYRSQPSDWGILPQQPDLPDDAVVFYVRDNGEGFDMQYAHKLFGVFQRLHRAEDYEGTGVGLAIVQRIIHRHDGQVWAQAKAGAGAVFYFTL